MKTTLATIALCLSVLSTAFAQSHQQEMADKIAEKHNWLYAYSFQKTITLNLSESMWQLALSEDKTPKGYTTAKRMGESFVNLSDKFGGTHLEQNCGFSANNEVQHDNHNSCQQEVDGWGGKYSLTLNALNAKGTSGAFDLVFGYLSSVAIYLGSGSQSIWDRGYSPRNGKVHIIINADDKYKTLAVSWNTDFTTVTISAPVTNEPEDWDSKIEKGLIAGWKK